MNTDESRLRALEHSGAIATFYPDSVLREGEILLFVFRDDSGRRLGALTKGKPSAPWNELEWTRRLELPDGEQLWSGPLTGLNTEALRENCEWCRPHRVGAGDSFGFGDRLGLANPGHLRALKGSSLRPVIAQQSVRELQRTRRQPEDVMDAATAAVFQEGYRGIWGADGDHLKTAMDVRRLARAGFTMFTFDPGEFVDHEADYLAEASARDRAMSLPEAVLGGTVAQCVERYADCEVALPDGFTLRAQPLQVLRAAVKYGRVVAHVVDLYAVLQAVSPEDRHEVELSVDETDSVTTPFEHYWLADRLRGLGVRIQSLAPRFPGAMEKGIDFRGDLNEFRESWKQHSSVAAAMGPYKLSLHSGSDKFSLYPVLAAHSAPFHVKTAGTSYLEALRAAGRVDPELLREILDFSRGVYEETRFSYHVSAALERVPPGAGLTAVRLQELLDDDDARQVFHVAFGAVLTAEPAAGQGSFRERLCELLDTRESIHFDCLIRHFGRHLALLDRGAQGFCGEGDPA